MRNLNSHRGIGLLELMLSIIVITAVILGATKYYLVAREAMRITQAQDIINNVANAGYKWAEGNPSFDNLPDDAMQAFIDGGLLPANYKTIALWGGQVNVAKGKPCTATDNLFWLSVFFTAAPTKACDILIAKYGACPSVCNNVSSCAATNAGNCYILFRSP